MIRFFFLYCIFIMLLFPQPKQKEIIGLQKPTELKAPQVNSAALNLERVIRSVEQFYPIILAGEQLLSAAEYDYLAAQGAFDLQFRSLNQTTPLGFYQNAASDNVFDKPTPIAGTSFFAGYRMGRGNFPSYDGKRATNEYGEVRVGAVVPLLRNRDTDKNRTDLKKSEMDKKLAELNLQKLKIEVIRVATQRYWKWVSTGQEYKVMKGLLEIAEKRVEQVKERVRLGDLPSIEITENDRVILQREAQLVIAERELQKASIDLSLFWRGETGAMIRPDESQLPSALPVPMILENMNVDSLLKKALDVRPDLREYAYKKEKFKLDMELAQNNLKPQVDLVVVGSQNMGPGSVTRTPTQVEANVVLNIPIQTRRQRGQIGSAQSQISKLEQEETFQRDKIKTEIQDSLSDMEALRKRVIVAEKEVKLARKLEELERDRFNLGDSTLLIVNIREQTAAEAAIREVRSLGDFQNSLANFRAVMAEKAVYPEDQAKNPN